MEREPRQHSAPPARGIGGRTAGLKLCPGRIGRPSARVGGTGMVGEARARSQGPPVLGVT